MEPEIICLKEVTCPDSRRVVMDKSSPGLTARSGGATAFQISLDGTPGDRQAQFQQFTADALAAPQAIVFGHATNERDLLAGQGWPPNRYCHSRLASPHPPKQIPVPAQQRLGFHDEQGLFPGLQPARQHDKQGPVAPAERRPLDLTLDPDQLLPQPGVFQQQIVSGTAEMGYRADDQRAWGRPGP